MFKKILVPVDGSERAEKALIPALALAHSTNGKIIMLRVPEYGSEFVARAGGLTFMRGKEEAVQHRLCNNYLRGVRQTHLDYETPIQIEVIDGDPAAVILDIAISEQIDLIVMTTHGRTGINRWMYGSVTERVLRHAPCPVLALRDELTLTHIVVPLDGSELAERSVEPALSLARIFKSDVTLLQVQVPYDELDEGQKQVVVDGKHDWIFTKPEAMHRLALEYLEQAKAKWADPSLNIQIAVTANLAAEGILHYVDKYHGNLVVMTTHGFTGLGRWDYGSVTSKVMRGTKTAMLIIPAPEEMLK